MFVADGDRGCRCATGGGGQAAQNGTSLHISSREANKWMGIESENSRVEQCLEPATKSKIEPENNHGNDDSGRQHWNKPSVDAIGGALSVLYFYFSHAIVARLPAVWKKKKKMAAFNGRCALCPTGTPRNGAAMKVSRWPPFSHRARVHWLPPRTHSLTRATPSPPWTMDHPLTSVSGTGQNDFSFMVLPFTRPI